MLLIHVLAVLCDSRKGSVGDPCSGFLLCTSGTERVFADPCSVYVVA